MNVFDGISNRWVLATAVAVFGVILALSLIGRASAQGNLPEPQCGNLFLICIELAPESDTNTVGSEHVVTATVTDEYFSGPFVGIDVTIWVVDGPNAGERIDGFTDGNGMLSFVYTGAEPGTDTIVAIACFPEEPGCLSQATFDLCLVDPTHCLSFLDPSGGCAEVEDHFCDGATKDWVAQAAAPAAELPATGGPTSSSGFPLAGAMALAGAAILAGGVALVRRALAT